MIETLLKKLGHLETAYLVGDYAQGIDSGLIDIILVGKINKLELDRIAERRGKRYFTEDSAHGRYSKRINFSMASVEHGSCIANLG